MGRFLILTFFLLAMAGGIFAQNITCTPDSTFADSTAGVYPKPYSDMNPMGGITDTVCLGTEFEYTFTLVIPDSFETNTALGTVPVNSFSASTESAVMNLPAGFDYACNPPNCVFSSDQGIGCIILYGQTDDSEAVGQYDLMISGLLNSILSLQITFPDSNLFEAGNYFLNVAANGTGPCTFLSTSEPFANQFSLGNRPNPFTDLTEITVQSKVNGEFELRIYNYQGQLEHRERIQLLQGLNTIPYDGGQLPNGMYLLTITDGFQGVSNKMVVHR